MVFIPRSEFVKLSGVPLSTVGDAIASLKIKTETDSRGRVLLPLSDVQSLIARLSRNIQPERLTELSERLRTLPEPDLSDLPKAPEGIPEPPKVDLPNPTEKREAPEGIMSTTFGNAFFIAPANREAVASKRSTVLSKLIFTSQTMRPYTLKR